MIRPAVLILGGLLTAFGLGLIGGKRRDDETTHVMPGPAFDLNDPAIRDEAAKLSPPRAEFDPAGNVRAVVDVPTSATIKITTPPASTVDAGDEPKSAAEAGEKEA